VSAAKAGMEITDRVSKTNRFIIYFAFVIRLLSLSAIQCSLAVWSQRSREGKYPE